MTRPGSIHMIAITSEVLEKTMPTILRSARQRLVVADIFASKEMLWSQLRYREFRPILEGNFEEKGLLLRKKRYVVTLNFGENVQELLPLFTTSSSLNSIVTIPIQIRDNDDLQN